MPPTLSKPASATRPTKLYVVTFNSKDNWKVDYMISTDTTEGYEKTLHRPTRQAYTDLLSIKGWTAAQVEERKLLSREKGNNDIILKIVGNLYAWNTSTKTADKIKSVFICASHEEGWITVCWFPTKLEEKDLDTHQFMLKEATRKNVLTHQPAFAEASLKIARTAHIAEMQKVKETKKSLEETMKLLTIANQTIDLLKTEKKEVAVVVGEKTKKRKLDTNDLVEDDETEEKDEKERQLAEREKDVDKKLTELRNGRIELENMKHTAGKLWDTVQNDKAFLEQEKVRFAAEKASLAAEKTFFLSLVKSDKGKLQLEISKLTKREEDIREKEKQLEAEGKNALKKLEAEKKELAVKEAEFKSRENGHAATVEELEEAKKKIQDLEKSIETYAVNHLLFQNYSLNPVNTLFPMASASSTPIMPNLTPMTPPTSTPSPALPLPGAFNAHVPMMATGPIWGGSFVPGLHNNFQNQFSPLPLQFGLPTQAPLPIDTTAYFQILAQMAQQNGQLPQ